MSPLNTHTLPPAGTSDARGRAPYQTGRVSVGYWYGIGRMTPHSRLLMRGLGLGFGLGASGAGGSGGSGIR